MKNTKNFLNECLSKKMFSNCALSIGDKNQEIFSYLLDSDDIATTRTTLFDIASITKVIACTVPLLMLVDKKELSLSNKLSDFFDCPNDKKDITIEHLLTHTSGISGTYRIEETAIKKENVIYDILNKPLVSAIGTQINYSCPSYILLGKILEKIYEDDLDEIFNKYVKPLFNLEKTTFKPSGNNIVYTNDKNQRGIVNDFNSKFLGGVSGNAGLFSCIDEMSKIAISLANNTNGIISDSLFKEAIRNHTTTMSEGRGLGFLVVDKNYKQTGKLFNVNSYGHCGYTGTSMFIDESKQLYVVFLSNITSHVVDYNIVTKFREDLHNAIYEDIRK